MGGCGLLPVLSLLAGSVGLFWGVWEPTMLSCMLRVAQEVTARACRHEHLAPRSRRSRHRRRQPPMKLLRLAAARGAARPWQPAPPPADNLAGPCARTLFGHGSL